MESLTAIFGLLALWIFGTLVVEQTKASAAQLASWLARKAASRLPPELRAVSEEEWIAVLANTEGPLLKVVTALDLHRGASRIIRDYIIERQRKAAQEPQHKRLDREAVLTVEDHLSIDEIQKTYARMRNYVVHMSSLHSDESLRRIQEFLEQELKSCGGEASSAFKMDDLVELRRRISRAAR